MPNYSIDYTKLSNSINRVEKKVYKLADVESKLEKVAFDIVRFKDGNPDELWQVQNSDDGSYIIARYDSDDAPAKSATASAQSQWAVLTNQTGDLNIFYKGQSIQKLASSSLGIPSEDVETAKRILPRKLANDNAFVKALLDTLDADSKLELIKQFPELSK